MGIGVFAAHFGPGKAQRMIHFAGNLNITDSMNGFRALTADAIKKMNIEADDFSTQDANAVVQKYSEKFAEAEKIWGGG